MKKMFVTIERDMDGRSSKDGARFRVRVRAERGGIALLSSTHAIQSVSRAKFEAESIFGKLSWQEETDVIRLSAEVRVL